jgi:hypothetical protein
MMVFVFFVVVKIKKTARIIGTLCKNVGNSGTNGTGAPGLR